MNDPVVLADFRTRPNEVRIYRQVVLENGYLEVNAALKALREKLVRLMRGRRLSGYEEFWDFADEAMVIRLHWIEDGENWGSRAEGGPDG